MKIAEIHTGDGPLLLRVRGPVSAFSIMVKTDEDRQYFKYDASRPGAVEIPAAHFAEINCSGRTIRLDGRPDDEANLSAGVDIEWSDWLSFRPNRENRVMCHDADVIVIAP